MGPFEPNSMYWVDNVISTYPYLLLFQTNSEVTKIVMQRLIKVDGKVRTDINFPAGFMGKF